MTLQVVCQYIRDLANPEGLEEGLKLVFYSNSSSQSFTKILDKIYTQILQNAVKNNDEDGKKKLCESFRSVVGSIIILSDVYLKAR